MEARVFVLLVLCCGTVFAGDARDFHCPQAYIRNYNPREMKTVTFSTLREVRSSEVRIRSKHIPVLTRSDLSMEEYSALVETKDSMRSFHDGTWINWLDLGGNELHEIGDAAFSGVSVCLQYVHLNHNNLTRITNQALRGLSDLRVLDLRHNQLKIIQDGAFEEMPLLDVLRLDNNNLSFVSGGMFTGLSQLTVLTLHGNRLIKLVDPTFENVRNLVHLDLSDNTLMNISPGAFKHLVNLTGLSLQKNHLRHLPIGIFTNLHNLTRLSLGENNLSLFKMGAFYGLPALRQLNLSYNALTNIQEKKLFTLQNLTELILDGNDVINSLHVPRIKSHLRKLARISVAEMPWGCEHLLHTMKEFIAHGIHVDGYVLANPIDTININGIRCTETDVEIPAPMSTVSPVHVTMSTKPLRPTGSVNKMEMVRPVDVMFTSVNDIQNNIAKNILESEQNLYRIVVSLALLTLLLAMVSFRDDISFSYNYVVGKFKRPADVRSSEVELLRTG